jgi:hypothetical protein
MAFSGSLMAQAEDIRSGVIMMKLQSLKTALINKDSVLLTKLLSEDVTYGHTNGMIQTKAQLIRDVVSGTQDYKNIDPSDISIRFYDNTAIVLMKANVELEYAKKPMELLMYITLVWVYKDNDWKLVARQSVNTK